MPRTPPQLLSDTANCALALRLVLFYMKSDALASADGKPQRHPASNFEVSYIDDTVSTELVVPICLAGCKQVEALGKQDSHAMDRMLKNLVSAGFMYCVLKVDLWSPNSQ